MISRPLTMLCYTDLSGALRGKGFPSDDAKTRLERGIAWTPTNLMFTALGTIARSEWQAFGDLTLMPDEKTAVEVDFEDGTPAERFYLCDVVNTDATPWECCPRTFLKRAVEDMEAETGLSLWTTFEHEFVYDDGNGRVNDNYALDAVRRHGCFGETYLAALEKAGVDVDSYMPEFGAGQFEVTVAPQDALAACDTAVIVKEMARATAWRLGHELSFSPRVSPEGLGSGVHIHFSLWNGREPASHDPGGPFGVSEPAGRFLAGVARHMPALCAFTAPSPASYLRLVPHSWTGVWSNIGLRDRDAGLRICPTFAAKDRAAEARQFNFEFRAADATGNPYLQLGMIIRAGLAGLREELAMPEPTSERDPGDMSEAEREHHRIVRLPTSLDAAFDALEADAQAQTFMPAPLLRAYRANKAEEREAARTWDAEEICRRYAQIY